MSSLRKRLRRLEQSGRIPCSECGNYLTGEEEWKVTWSHHDPDDTRESGMEVCDRCGRITHAYVKLTWD
jgi:hypothetical protein